MCFFICLRPERRSELNSIQRLGRCTPTHELVYCELSVLFGLNDPLILILVHSDTLQVITVENGPFKVAPTRLRDENYWKTTVNAYSTPPR